MKIRFLLCTALALPACAFGYAYKIQDCDTKGCVPLDIIQDTGTPIVWPGTLAVLDLNLDSTALGTGFNEQAASALDEWSAAGSAFQWSTGGGSGDPCAHDDETNSTGWSGTNCGESFGDILAVTSRRYQATGASPYHLIDTDIVFNQDHPWSPRAAGPWNTASYDFRRVALHEIGHALGLDHPDEATPPQSRAAIMNSSAGNLETLQDDDKAGVAVLYPGGGGIPVNPPGGTGSGGGGGGAWWWPASLLLWFVRRRGS